MAQLVKLSDYVSRYEIDIYRYPSRYVRLKRERWERVRQDWETRKKGFQDLPLWHSYEDNSESFIQKSLRKLPWKKSEIQEEVELPTRTEITHHSLEKLKQSFREELFQFQLNWASSTISEKSHVKRSYYYDKFLYYLLQNLPDTFFVFYEPVFFMKKAPVDLDVIILTPTELWLIKPLSGNDHTIYQTETDRFWKKSENGVEERLLNPFVTLKRMKTVVETILTENHITLPVKMAVVAKDSFIDVPPVSKRVNLVDKRQIENFKKLLLKNQTPIKHQQLKVAETLLAHSLTISENRLQEEIDEEQREETDSRIEND
ncbi:NERD domain-containing protein [Salipaludibacillus agaradhaerens]|jgi:hypothetical protein|uniref:NERD domain-containing protein n=1 Tax=Salipaludibacillus agaradhaerens TaxID=76935 RepID=A0A9Q4AZ65_SALAG|nr:nuclease-related domain-containing protein [Salipaludibacillus agaradhaerens]MCR6095467.1 NERD domain-containing protein [Salipaludibacillus agaradhaerens]MCR6114973.1 NERD domain-containing protein [Salipaludibacillus agaradhaerens]UJW58687.1 NERD domain-containing protein [Bacillus sp. A116_S68]